MLDMCVLARPERSARNSFACSNSETSRSRRHLSASAPPPARRTFKATAHDRQLKDTSRDRHRAVFAGGR